ncbi:MAG: pyrroloquinoline quinone biosynthesis peptide chaperone PqqD [Tateyamaria sp.]|uniref:pyrroloquinoline quinone biosynthesis peptide chaperone PqqD n=1 Tax=Tateyamaria sp. TaxID=1929288 RepID=UPI00329CD2E8
MIAQDTIPVILRGVRLHEDKVRGGWVLLAPERTINLDPIGLAILNEVDGECSLGNLVSVLAAKYQAPAEQIEGDVTDFLTGLADRRFLEFI